MASSDRASSKVRPRPGLQSQTGCMLVRARARALRNEGLETQERPQWRRHKETNKALQEIHSLADLVD